MVVPGVLIRMFKATMVTSRTSVVVLAETIGWRTIEIEKHGDLEDKP